MSMRTYTVQTLLLMEKKSLFYGEAYGFWIPSCTC